MQQKDYLSIKEISQKIGVSVSTVRRLIKAGDFPKKLQLSPKKKSIRYSAAALSQWIDGRVHE